METTMIEEIVIEKIERIGSHIYDEFRAGAISFEVCEASLAAISEAVNHQVWLGIPEEGR